MKDTLITECLNILKSENVQKELRYIFSPAADLILHELYPYIYVIVLLVVMVFILILTILVLLIVILRNNKMLAWSAHPS
jgi:hypothetical protein